VSIAKNYLYNLILTISDILVPFITIPYITRVLNPDGIGAVSFTNSVIEYFTMFSILGLNLYGPREIASSRNNPEKIRTTFWNIQYAKVFTVITSYTTFLIFFFFFSNEKYHSLYIIQSFIILNNLFDITFLFSGLEDFQKITIRGLLVKIVGASLIFLLIKKPSDYILYALINVLSTLFGTSIMWFYLPKNLKITNFSFEEIKNHLFGSLKLFIPILAIQIYTVLDKTMVGVLSTEAEVSFYTMSQRLVKIILALITSLGPVMMSRISNLVSTDQHEKVEGYISVIFDFVTYASILAIILTVFTMNDFVPFFFGSKFLKVKDLIIYITPIILFISWSNLFGIQLMVPMKKENYLTISVIIGAVTNFTLNLILIPKYQSLGAVIGTVIAEFTVTLVLIILVRKLINLKPLFNEVWKHLLAGLATFSLLFFFTKINISPFINIILKISIGISSYILIEYILKSTTNKMIIQKILGFLKRT